MKFRIISYPLFLFLLINLIGCDAFVRKFTRKPKGEQYKQEELVLEPEEYKPSLDKEGQYRQYFVFWRAWQDELIMALLASPNQIPPPNHKKQVDCADEAVKNLMSMRTLLNDKGQKKLDVYITQMVDLRDSIEKDVYTVNRSNYRFNADRLRRDILQNFSFGDIKNSEI